MNRINNAVLLLVPVFVGGIAVADESPKPADSKVLEIGTRKQLFVDDYIVATKKNVKRVLGGTSRANGGRPVIVDDQPWEKFGTPIIGSVIRDRGKFRMWYRGAGGGPTGGVWCYAESYDGIEWKKPKLGLVEFKGNKDNNIYVMGQPQAFTPFVDPNEKDSAKWYKSAVNTARIDTGLAYSRDGLRWKSYRGGKAITGRASDTISQVLWDPYSKVYRLYTRTDFGTGGGKNEIRGTRDMVANANADLADPKSWRKVREWCLGWEKGDREYHKKRQIYSLNGWIHEGVQFGLLWTLDEPGGREFMSSYLATTRGNKPWNLEWVYKDKEFIARGRGGRFDSRWVQTAPNIVTWKDYHWIFYVGLARSHAGKVDPRLTQRAAGIGVALVPLDGFVVLEASKEMGVVTTKPFKLAGTTLEVNVDARRGGIRVEVLDADGKPIRKFASADSEFVANFRNMHWQPSWKNGKSLSALKNRTIRLRFHLQNCKLRAFQLLNQGG